MRASGGEAPSASRADVHRGSAMQQAMERMVALLRAVNVSGRKLPMAELRALCEEILQEMLSA
jgi:hypothetical protein